MNDCVAAYLSTLCWGDGGSAARSTLAEFLQSTWRILALKFLEKSERTKTFELSARPAFGKQAHWVTIVIDRHVRHLSEAWASDRLGQKTDEKTTFFEKWRYFVQTWQQPTQSSELQESVLIASDVKQHCKNTNIRWVSNWRTRLKANAYKNTSPTILRLTKRWRWSETELCFRFRHLDNCKTIYGQMFQNNI